MSQNYEQTGLQKGQVLVMSGLYCHKHFGHKADLANTTEELSFLLTIPARELKQAQNNVILLEQPSSIPRSFS